MKFERYVFFGFLVFLIGVILGYEFTERTQEARKDAVLSEASEFAIEPTLSPTDIPTPTLVASPTLHPTLVPTLRPTTTPISYPSVSSTQIHSFIERFSAQYGVDPNVLRHIAICESEFNPRAVNGPYAGLYQFSGNTWKSHRILMGEDTNSDLRFNAEEAVQTAAFVLSSGRKDLWPNCYPG